MDIGSTFGISNWIWMGVVILLFVIYVYNRLSSDDDEDKPRKKKNSEDDYEEESEDESDSEEEEESDEEAEEPDRDCAFQTDWTNEDDEGEACSNWSCGLAENSDHYCDKEICPFWKNHEIPEKLKGKK